MALADDPLLDLDEAARVVRLSEGSMRTYCAEGRLVWEVGNDGERRIRGAPLREARILRPREVVSHHGVSWHDLDLACKTGVILVDVGDRISLEDIDHLRRWADRNYEMEDQTVVPEPAGTHWSPAAELARYRLLGSSIEAIDARFFDTPAAPPFEPPTNVARFLYGAPTQLLDGRYATPVIRTAGWFRRWRSVLPVPESAKVVGMARGYLNEGAWPKWAAHPNRQYNRAAEAWARRWRESRPDRGSNV